MIITIKSLSQDTYTNDIGMQFIKVPSGEYISSSFHPTVSKMIAWGSKGPLNDSVYRQAIAMAHHADQQGFNVEVSSFYIGKYEVTQGQWKKVMHINPSYFQQMNVTDDADLHPVENISYKMALRFIKKLNRAQQDTIHYRLPTEREWEYAARAGMKEDIAWSEIQASAIIARVTTAMVGQMKPNAWGIYDLLGNVWEWTLDFYNEKIFADLTPPSRSKQHVLKGASFFGDVKNATYKTHAAGPGSGFDVGLRLVIEAKK